jgi:hypothetical protein
MNPPQTQTRVMQNGLLPSASRFPKEDDEFSETALSAQAQQKRASLNSATIAC